MGMAGAIVGLEETYNQYKESLVQEQDIMDLEFLSSNSSMFRPIFDNKDNKDNFLNIII